LGAWPKGDCVPIKLNDLIGGTFMLVKSLLNDGLDSNFLTLQGFDFLIRDTKVYCIYSVKFEIDKRYFRSWFFNHVDKKFFDSNLQLIDYLDAISHWYPIYLDTRRLDKGSASLKKDAKRWYKENINKELKGFDRFFEETRKLFMEAHNIYTVVFYGHDAIHKNIQFSEDRSSCYITTQTYYYDVLSQLSSFYVMIYKDSEPISRVLAVLSDDCEYITIFNLYGYTFKDLSRLFPEDMNTIDHSILNDLIGVYVNQGVWLISKDASRKAFVYQVKCPTCGSITHTDCLEVRNNQLKCENCYDVNMQVSA